jgi:2-polyprenyl-6-methoxyphenol hydroxylase-like FAD-dependent oxidoreductase
LWRLGHRVKLHTALKEAAQSAGAELRLATSVTAIDPESGVVTTNDGSIDADVVVGADGVHSISRQLLGDQKPFSSGKSAFRFLIPRQAVLDDPQTRKYAEHDGDFMMVFHKDRRLVMYPTNDNTLLNFVCIHPEADTAAVSSGDWNNKATTKMLLHVYADFHEDFRAILSKAEESSLKIWRLLDMVSVMLRHKSG